MPPRTMSRLLILFVAAPVLCTGCTSAQLRLSTIAQSTTLQDIYTQQVMNNLAVFIANPDALPFFAYPNQGTTAIQDQGNFGNLGYSSGHFASSPFALNATRQATENWVLVPVSDPAKLGLMRCAYRQAISSCIPVAPPSASDCQDCSDLRRDFYGPSDPETGNPHFNEELPCLNSNCWLAWGCKSEVPKNCGAPYVGAYHGLYVWVTPDGRDMLTKLTLSILDYAVNDASQFAKRNKTVEIYVNQDGSINYKNNTGVRIIATVPIDVTSDTIAMLDRSAAYGQFLKQFSKADAERVLAIAEQSSPGYAQLTDEQKKTYWKGVDPDSPLWPADLKKAVTFIRDNNLLPSLIPSDAVLHGPAAYERKGTASDALQQLGQRLNAALAPSSATGH